MKKHIPGIIILLCAAVVIVWQAGGLLASRPGDDFALKAADFDSFELKLDGWNVDQLEVVDTFMEVNLLKYMLKWQVASGGGRGGGAGGACETIDTRPQTEDSTTEQPDKSSNASGLWSKVYGLRSSPPQVLVRLVHGYNMRDCMRIKGYEVQELDFEKPEGGNLKPENGIGFATTKNAKHAKREGASSGLPSIAPEERRTGLMSNVYGLWSNPPHPQLWLLTSPSGDTSLWMSGILRTGDFSPMDLSVTDMPFPRVGTPTDPNWIPRGLTWKSLRHPIRNFKYVLNAKWNGARCDLLTFLGLRKPAWASDDALTLMVIMDIPAEVSEEAVALMQGIYSEVLSQLRSWRAGGPRAEVPTAPLRLRSGLRRVNGGRTTLD